MSACFVSVKQNETCVGPGAFASGLLRHFFVGFVFEMVCGI